MTSRSGLRNVAKLIQSIHLHVYWRRLWQGAQLAPVANHWFIQLQLQSVYTTPT